MTTTLRPYQIEDIIFLSKKYSGACFNQQRTGKTPTALLTMQRKKCKKVLIVCPASIIPQWCTEITKWLQQTSIMCLGTRAQRIRLIQNWSSGFLIVSYDALKETKKSEGLISYILKQKPDGVILDEAHRIKSKKAANTKACFKLSKITHKLALTATPAPNYQYEVWGILRFLFPQQFKAYWAFIERFFEIKQKYAGRHTVREIGSFKSTKTQLEFQKILAQFATQRTRKEIMPWLPDKEYMRVNLTPTLLQQKYLQNLTDHFEIPNSKVITHGPLDRLMAYRQVCTCPAMLELKGESAKLIWLRQFLTDYPKRRCIIFTEFSSAFPFISKYIPSPYVIIDGKVPIKKRDEIKMAFQTGEVSILLAQIETCKEGLTLDGADTIVFLDKFPPVSDIQQAEDRFVATTVEKSKKEHLIVELVLQNTYDEELYNLLAVNAAEVDVINNFNKYLGAKPDATS